MKSLVVGDQLRHQALIPPRGQGSGWKFQLSYHVAGFSGNQPLS